MIDPRGAKSTDGFTNRPVIAMRSRTIARRTGLAAVMMLVLALPGAASAQEEPVEPELRAVWVDAFHHGIRSPSEAAQLVADAKRLHLNTLIVQVRRRGDALYTGGLEPPLDDPAYDPSFDALAHVVSVAHDAGLQVHAWINAMPVWRDEAPPKDARHVFNRHGPGAAGAQCWLTSTRGGTRKFPVGYFLDPGHPAARDHLVAVYLDIVRRYDIDGIHFDYIRYPETEGPALPRGADVGYNPVSVARFQRELRRKGVPLPDDEAWTRWRREQVTGLIRRIAIEARAIKPRLKVGAAVIAWGAPPATDGEFENTAPMQRVFQDWRGWLEEGIIDLAVPMNYAREHDERGRSYYDGWIAWEKRNKSDRHVAVGVGGYLSAPEGVLAQIGRARSAEGGPRADGVSLFSYYQPFAAPATLAAPPVPAAPVGAPLAPAAPAPVAPPEPTAAAPAAQAPSEAAPAPAVQAVPAGSTPPPSAPPPPPPAPERLDYLVLGAGSAPAAFAGSAPVPAMPWIERPAEGWIAGTVVNKPGKAVERRTIRIRSARGPGKILKATSDASGWFGMARLAPGTYRVQLENEKGKTVGSRIDVVVTAGSVSRVRLAAN